MGVAIQQILRSDAQSSAIGSTGATLEPVICLPICTAKTQSEMPVNIFYILVSVGTNHLSPFHSLFSKECDNQLA